MVWRRPRFDPKCYSYTKILNQNKSRWQICWHNLYLNACRLVTWVFRKLIILETLLRKIPLVFPQLWSFHCNEFAFLLGRLSWGWVGHNVGVLLLLKQFRQNLGLTFC